MKKEKKCNLMSYFNNKKTQFDADHDFRRCRDADIDDLHLS